MGKDRIIQTFIESFNALLLAFLNRTLVLEWERHSDNSKEMQVTLTEYFSNGSCKSMGTYQLTKSDATLFKTFVQTEIGLDLSHEGKVIPLQPAFMC